MGKVPEPTDDSPGGWILSLAFWLSLFAAAGLYACVSLAPKLLTHLKLSRTYHANQVRLVRLERQVDYLKKVAEALRNDPEFAAELARIDFDAARPGTERIPVDPRLSLSAQDAPPPLEPPPDRWPWYTPVLRLFAADESMRRTTLVVAALLVILAFTFLQDEPKPAAGTSFRSSWQRLVDRYRRPSPDV